MSGRGLGQPLAQRRNPQAVGRLNQFLAGLPPEYVSEGFRIDEVSGTELLERLVAIEHRLQRNSAELDRLQQDVTVRRDTFQQEAAARLQLLGRITWIAAAVVGMDSVLLLAVILASAYTTYYADE